MLLTHQASGWKVDPARGKVYGADRWGRTREVGSRNSYGYLRSQYWDAERGRQRHVSMHIIVWEAAEGPIPPGYTINHRNGIKSDNRRCNIECVTMRENIQHAYDTGLHVRIGGLVGKKGVEHRCAKLNPELGRQLLLDYRSGVESQRQLAARYGVSQSTVSRIARGVSCWVSPSTPSPPTA